MELDHLGNEIHSDKDRLFIELYRFVDKISHTTGEIITEYHWREAIGLAKAMEDKGLVNIKTIKKNINTNNDIQPIETDELLDLFDDLGL